MEILKERIKSELRQKDHGIVENKFGRFKISVTNTWKFSPAVAKLKEKEIEKGIAQEVVSERLNFTPNAMVA